MNAGKLQEFVDDMHEGRAVSVDKNLGFHGPSIGVRYLTGG